MRSEGPQRLLGAARSPAPATPGLGEPPAPGQRGWTAGDTARGAPRLELPITRAKGAGMLPERSSRGGSGRGMQLGASKGDAAGMEGSCGKRGDAAERGRPAGIGPPSAPCTHCGVPSLPVSPLLFPPLSPSVPLGARVFWPLCPNLAAAPLPSPSAPLTPGTSPGDKRAAT